LALGDAAQSTTERKYIMTKANKAQAFNVLNTFADSRVALIQGMQKAGYATLEESKNVVIEWACEKTGCTFTSTAAGKNRLVSGHKKYEAAKTTVRDVMLMLQGTTRRKQSNKKESTPKVVIMGCETVEEAIEAFNAALAAKFGE
jgi:hypothetical protein